MLAEPLRIATADVVHAVGHDHEVRLLREKFVQIADAVRDAPPADGAILQCDLAIEARLQLRDDEVGIAGLVGSGFRECRGVEPRGDAVATDAEGERFARLQSGRRLRERADLLDSGHRLLIAAAVGDLDVAVVEPPARMVHQRFLGMTHAGGIALRRTFGHEQFAALDCSDRIRNLKGEREPIFRERCLAPVEVEAAACGGDLHNLGSGEAEPRHDRPVRLHLKQNATLAINHRRSPGR